MDSAREHPEALSLDWVLDEVCGGRGSERPLSDLPFRWVSLVGTEPLRGSGLRLPLVSLRKAWCFSAWRSCGLTKLFLIRYFRSGFCLREGHALLEVDLSRGLDEDRLFALRD